MVIKGHYRPICRPLQPILKGRCSHCRPLCRPLYNECLRNASSASAPTQPPSTSLPSDITSDTTASGDSKLGRDSASAALTLNPNSDVKVKTFTTGKTVTAVETYTLPSANQPATASVKRLSRKS